MEKHRPRNTSLVLETHDQLIKELGSCHKLNKKAVKAMHQMEKGGIEPFSNHEFNLVIVTMVLVKRKDRSVRFCASYSQSTDVMKIAY